MNTQRKRNPWRWTAILLAVALVAGGVYLYATGSTLLTGGTATQSTTTFDLPTVAIQPADIAESATSASGNLALVAERSVPLAVGGVVNEIAVAVGDQVELGQVLLRLDTTELERALAQAELSVESAQITLADLSEEATAAELAQAEAAVSEAEENLADVKAGPSASEIAAAQSSLAAAGSSYNELVAGPSQDELTQLSASLRKAEITLADAQRAYDQVSWQPSAGSSSAAVELQSATIDYESALAAYQQSTAAASDSSLQSAVSSIQNAQTSLDSLLGSPTPAEIASAEAQLAEAQATLADLQAGPTANEQRSAEITMEKALIELESAQRDLDAAVLTAPTAGVVTAVNASLGTRSSADSVLFTLTDPTQLELEIGVAESDIPNVALGQEATIEVDAFPGKSYTGVVAAISPVNDSSASSVSYPVTIRLTSDDLTGVLPGMNAVATLTSQVEVAANSWLVPTNAVRSSGDSSTVTVVRNGVPTRISVTTGAIQGEYTLVQSAELQAGDAVVGTLSTNDSGDSFFGGPGGGGMGVPIGGPPD